PQFMTSLPLALSLTGCSTRVGAIVAFAAVLGVAILSLLVFSQARELKRLRDWAGRAPERAADLEHRVTTAAARVQERAPGAQQPARPAAPVPGRAVAAAGPATRVVGENQAAGGTPAGGPAVVPVGQAVTAAGAPAAAPAPAQASTPAPIPPPAAAPQQPPPAQAPLTQSTPPAAQPAADR